MNRMMNSLKSFASANNADYDTATGSVRFKGDGNVDMYRIDPTSEYRADGTMTLRYTALISGHRNALYGSKDFDEYQRAVYNSEKSFDSLNDAHKYITGLVKKLDKLQIR